MLRVRIILLLSCVIAMPRTGHAERFFQTVRPRIVEDLSTTIDGTINFVSIDITQWLEIPKVDPSEFILHGVTGKFSGGTFAHSVTFGRALHFHRIQGLISADDVNIFKFNDIVGGANSWSRVEFADGNPGGITTAITYENIDLSNVNGTLEIDDFVQRDASTTRRLLIDFDATASVRLEGGAVYQILAAVMGPQIEFTYELEPVGQLNAIEWDVPIESKVYSNGYLNDYNFSNLIGEVPAAIAQHIEEVYPIPEPSTGLLMSLGFVSCVLSRRSLARRVPLLACPVVRTQ